MTAVADLLRMETRKPCVAMADVTAPIAFKEPIAGDALIALAAITRYQDERVLDQLPIARRNGVYQAGTAVMEAPFAKIMIDQVHRKNVGRDNPARLARLEDAETVRIHTMSPYRIKENRFKALFGVERVYFPFVGDPERLQDLLRDLPGVGKNVATGYGTVRSWQVVEVDPENPQTFGFATANSKPARAISNKMAEEIGVTGGRECRTRTTPPYWDKTDRVDCLAPKWQHRVADDHEDVDEALGCTV